MAQTRITSRSLQLSSVAGENLVDGAITNSKIATNTIDVSKISNTALEETTPIGTIIWYTAELPPDGYLFADGSVVKRTSYQQLFDVIGTTYNTGNEANDEFRLPDLRGQFIRGWDNTGTVDPARIFGSKQEEDWKSFYMENVGTNVPFGTTGNNYNHSWDYQGKSTTEYIGRVFGGWWAAPAAAIGVRWDHYESRPENIALSPCIKFGNVLKAKSLNITSNILNSKVSKSNPVMNGNLFVNGNFSKNFQIGIKSGAASYVSTFKNRWVKGFQMGDYVDAKSNTDGIVIKKSGYYEVIAWQRGSNNGGNPYIALSLNGDRTTLENRADGIWTHSHTGGLAYNYSWSMYYGFLNVNEIISAGPPNNTDVSGSGYLMYSNVANTGYTGGLMIKSLNSYV